MAGGFSNEAKVGIFVVLGIAILAYMTIRLGSFQLGAPEGYPIWAVFDNATGVKLGAPVEMAGIQIGEVKNIELDGGRARLTFVIDPKVKLPADSMATIRTRGILGDKYVALERGSSQAPVLEPGQKLAKAQVPTDLDQVMAQIGDIAKDVKDITSSLRVSIGSPESEHNIKESLGNIRELTASLKVLVAHNQESINRMVANLDSFATDLRDISAENKNALHETIVNFRDMSAQLNQTLAKVGPQLEETITGLTSVIEKIDRGEGTIGALVNERQTIDDLNSTLASLKDVARKIDEGEGTIGKLVNDDTTITKIDEALTGINDYLTQGDAWRVYVDYRGEYLFRENALKSTLNLRLQPSADKFYLLGVVFDPLGQRTEKDTVTTTTEDGVTYTRTEKSVTQDKDDILFNAQIGKRFHNLTARGGIFQSTGGVGLDYHLWDDDLTLTFEAYDFRQDDNPHLKFAADWSFWKYFYITAGMDNFVSQHDEDSFFMGGGVKFFDDDLKFLLTKAPSP